MKDVLDLVISFLNSLVAENGLVVSIVFASLIIVVESIIPIIPLAVFIGINIIVLGPVLGFVISWLATSVGCMIAFAIFRELLSSRIKKDSKVHKATDFVDRVKFANLVTVLAFPFTPAFLINIGAGLSHISYREYFFAIVISKLSVVYFWGFVGANFEESFTNPMIALKLVLIITLVYIGSKLLNKKMNIEG